MQWEALGGMFLGSMFKFIAGPATGAVLGFSFWEIFITTVGGMMTSITFVTFLGVGLRQWLLKRYPPKRKITARKRRIVRIWRKYGMWGVAFFTPIFFSPIGGTMIALSFGEAKQSILLKMLICVIFWGIIFSCIASYWGASAFEYFNFTNNQ